MVSEKYKKAVNKVSSRPMYSVKEIKEIYDREKVYIYDKAAFEAVPGYRAIELFGLKTIKTFMQCTDNENEKMYFLTIKNKDGDIIPKYITYAGMELISHIVNFCRGKDKPVYSLDDINAYYESKKVYIGKPYREAIPVNAAIELFGIRETERYVKTIKNGGWGKVEEMYIEIQIVRGEIHRFFTMYGFYTLAYNQNRRNVEHNMSKRELHTVYCYD